MNSFNRWMFQNSLICAQLPVSESLAISESMSNKSKRYGKSLSDSMSSSSFFSSAAVIETQARTLVRPSKSITRSRLNLEKFLKTDATVQMSCESIVENILQIEEEGNGQVKKFR